MSEFTYTTTTGKTVTMPDLGSIPVGVIRKTRNLPEIDQVFTILESLMGDDELAAFDELTAPEVTEVIEAWKTGGGVGLGESVPSSTSTKATQPRSKRT